jgi:hypothetical protein
MGALNDKFISQGYGSCKVQDQASANSVSGEGCIHLREGHLAGLFAELKAKRVLWVLLL